MLLFEVLEVIVRGKLRMLKCIYRSTAPQTPCIGRFVALSPCLGRLALRRRSLLVFRWSDQGLSILGLFLARFALATLRSSADPDGDGSGGFVWRLRVVF